MFDNERNEYRENENGAGSQESYTRPESQSADQSGYVRAGSQEGYTRSEGQNTDQQDMYTRRDYRDTSYIPQEREVRGKKKGSMAVKVAGVTAAALLFGTVAGGTMFAVNTVGELVKGRYTTESTSEPVTVAQAETSGNTGSGGNGGVR